MVNFKPFCISLFLLFICHCPGLSALGSNSLNISVSAQIMESIELTTLQDMKLGEVQPSRGLININPIIDPDAGKMVASGIPSAQIRVSFLREWELENDRSNHTLIFYYEVAGNPVDNQSTAELLNLDNRNLQFNGEGKYYFWIGGRVLVSDAQPGNYRGEFTIEIEYI